MQIGRYLDEQPLSHGASMNKHTDEDVTSQMLFNSPLFLHKICLSLVLTGEITPSYRAIPCMKEDGADHGIFV